MYKNSKKEGLLVNGKYRLQMEQEWVELQDYRQPPKLVSNNFEDHSNPARYYPLEDNVPQKNKRLNYSSPQETPFDPNVIKINGDTFQAVDKKKPEPPKAKKSKIPTMNASCFYCSTIQTIPGTSQVFICGACHKTNDCNPAYGIFICGTCQSKVLYATATSAMIRCTKCSTINKIPPMIRKNNFQHNPYITKNEYNEPIRDEQIRMNAELVSQLEQLTQKNLYPDL